MRVDGVESRAEAGTRAVVPPATPHDWWNVGGDTTWVIIEVIPGQRFEAMIRNLFGLAADGRTDRNGRPRLLQTALFAREFDDTVQFTSPPLAVQRTLCAVAPLARLRGVHGRCREYEQRTGPSVDELEELPPEAAVLAAL